MKKVLGILCLSLFMFTACGDDDEAGTENATVLALKPLVLLHA